MEKLHPDAGAISVALSPFPQPSAIAVVVRQPTEQGNVLYCVDLDRYESTDYQKIEERVAAVHERFEFQCCRVKGVILDESWSSSQTRMALYKHRLRVLPVQITTARSSPASREGVENLRQLDLVECIARLLTQNRMKLMETVPHREELMKQLENVGYRPDQKTKPVDMEEEAEIHETEFATAVMLAAWFLEVKTPSSQFGQHRSHIGRHYNPLRRELD